LLASLVEAFAMTKYLLIPAISVGLLSAQVVSNPTQSQSTSTNQVVTLDRQPIYRITVVSRTAKAINYRHRGGATKVDFQGTALMPKARGEAKVESKQGYIEVEVEFDNLSPATQFGPEYLTYVMWAVSPEGRASNLGEVLLNGTKSKLNVSSDLQAFGMIVTAEPYFAVTQPSDVVVMENIVRNDTKGAVEEIDAKYELLQRGQYVFNVDRSRIKSFDVRDTNTPIELYEARNAVQIARWTGADKYATDSFLKAENLLKQSEDYHIRKQKKPTSMMAREAVQTAEDSRVITIRRIEEERLAKERQDAADREAKAKAEAERSDQIARNQTARASQADLERAAAERAKAEAIAAQQQAARDRAEADAARQAALLQQQAAQQDAERARLAATESDRLRQQAETDRERLRKQLLDQFNMILSTRDTARGLIVNMSDVLFDTAKYTLRPAAREKLARIAGIVLSHPGLRLEVEGHTDSVGGDSYNQTLSEQRANSVREYLVSNGISPAFVTAVGFGKTMPVASNDNAAGRQMNRRVELVVSGEVIGTSLSGARTSPAPPNQR
jgi:outer membrane protein OmpA-like peptidoglycan-associated protein